MMSLSSQSVAATSIAHQPVGRRIHGRAGFNRALPFEAIGWIAVIVDFIIIMTTSILADAATISPGTCSIPDGKFARQSSRGPSYP
jgi:hypothetical protein